MNDATLTDYCNTFLGFGSWEVPVWFIGIEEAGGKNLEDVENRLRAWDDRGRKPLEDAPQFYPASGNILWHGTNAEIQPTWRQLIRMLLLAQGKSDTDSIIRNYQRSQLGCENGETCLMELFPLPSPNIEVWNYTQWTTLAWLQTRKNYAREMRAKRENELRRQITEHEPRVVIFYGRTPHSFLVGPRLRVDVLNKPSKTRRFCCGVRTRTRYFLYRATPSQRVTNIFERSGDSCALIMQTYFKPIEINNRPHPGPRPPGEGESFAVILHYEVVL